MYHVNMSGQVVFIFNFLVKLHATHHCMKHPVLMMLYELTHHDLNIIRFNLAFC